VLASNAPIPAGLEVRIPGLPETLRAEFAGTFGAGVALVGEDELRGAAVVSDAANFLPAALTEAALSYRRMVLDLFPYELLVN